MRFPRVLAALALAACSAAAQSPPQAAPQPEPERHFLWEVVSMTNKAYLFGTIHAGKREWYPLPRVVEEALADAQVLAVEADVTDLDALAKGAEGGSYTPPDELSKNVFPGDYTRFQRQLERFSIPEERMKNLKPFTAVSLLMFAEWSRLGYQPQFGIDEYLVRKAKAERKKVVEMEGVEAQAKLMDSLTDQEQRAVFAGTLTALESGLTSEQIEGMVKAWQLGDPFLMLQVARRYNEKVPGARELEEKFVWSRHDAMVEKIDGYLNRSKDRHFIAVGSLHLTGPKGLVELLRKRGYLVKQK